MGNKTAIIVLMVLLVLLGGIFAYSSMHHSSFTFYQSELQINQNQINETLYFSPNQDLHTLYRNFDSLITESQNPSEESVLINDVSCSSGKSYYQDYLYQCFTNGLQIKCPDYTEANEYGCTFGSVKGFLASEQQTIHGEYSIQPPSLFKYQEKYYIKFIAYVPGKHPYLKLNKNFFVSGALSLQKYYSTEKVILYIEYNPGENISFYNVVEVSQLDFSTNSLKRFFTIFSCFIPFLFFLIIYLIFLRKPSVDVPRELSEAPSNLKPWQVSSLYNFSQNKALPSTILDFYRRKIIDLKTEDKKTSIRLLKAPKNLDQLETKIYQLLVKIEKLNGTKQGYFELDFEFDLSQKAREVMVKSREISKFLFVKASEKINYLGTYITLCGFLVLSFLLFSINPFAVFVSGLAIFVALGVAIASPYTLVKYKKQDDSIEYEKWQSFKRFLKNSYSMKASDVKGIIIWNEYLVYATALGVSKKILKRLKEQGLINQEQYNTNIVLISSFNSFASSTGMSSGSSGGGGGAGGGGAGGGGGGGR